MLTEIISDDPETTSISHLILDLIESFVIALVIFVVVYNFIAQPHRVRGDSMLPNYHNDEYILTEKLTYRFIQPQRGDVIVLKYPENPSVDFIKRVIALPGETVLLENGKVYINDHLLTEPYISNSVLTKGNSSIKEGIPYKIPSRQYVVFGDNRTRSSDSRTWGTVPEENIVGKGFFVYWPFSSLGRVSYQERPTLSQD